MSRLFLNEVTLAGVVENAFLNSVDDKKMLLLNLLVQAKQKDINTGEIRTVIRHHTINIYNPRIVENAHLISAMDNVYINGELHNTEWKDGNKNTHKPNQIVVTGYEGDVKVITKVSSTEEFFSINKVCLAGNIGSINYDEKKAICNFSLATNSYHKDPNSGETKQTTDWHSISVYTPHLVRRMSTLKPGDNVYVKGEIRNSEWVDENSVPHRTLKIVANRDIKIISRKFVDKENTNFFANEEEKDKNNRSEQKFKKKTWENETEEDELSFF